MGNQTPSLTSRLRYNDRTLEELELISPPSELGVEDLNEFFQALRDNRTVKSMVITNAFSDVVIGPIWGDFLEALVCIETLEQLELLEVDIPFYSMPRILERRRSSLKCVGIHESLSTGIKLDDIEMLYNSLMYGTSLEEFVWEQNFQSLSRENNSSALDPLLSALSNLPNLQLLTISGSPTNLVPLFSPMALESFCQNVKFSNALVTLDLSGCGLGAFHMEVLLTTIASNKSIRTLHVQRNQARDLTPLLQLVQENYFLQDIHRMRLAIGRRNWISGYFSTRRFVVDCYQLSLPCGSACGVRS
jgi:hypothetical protein